MESFIQKIISLHVNYIIILFIACFYILEHFQQTSPSTGNRLDHLFNNILVYLSVILFSYIIAFIEVFCIQWINDHHFGLLNQIHLPFAAKAFIGIICFDFTAYWTHRLTHRSAILWRLHRVHHSDTTMDASTFFRHHPLEVIVTGTAAVIASALFGLDASILGLYVFILIPLMIAQHTNFCFPLWADTILGKVFVTPNLHKVHHAQDQFYTDSNFADIFILWDRLFGTYKWYSAGKVVYGLKEFDEKNKQTFLFLIKSPFLHLPNKRGLPQNKKL